MNDKERQFRRNNTRRLFRHTSGIHVNCVRINIGSTQEHERTKFDVCTGLAHLGHDFITEAELENRTGRCDIVDLDDGIIYEIVHSEKEESLDMKKGKYPLPIKFIHTAKQIG